ncbi:MAG: rhodanese-like domain-containing protein [Pseudomonadales bacterium]|nr:rhodanese-like domain-containing protein [Pseudomonadales bacterium]
MIEQLFEFIGNHLLLVGLFIVLLVAFFINEGRRGGSSVSTTELVSLVNRENAIILDIRDKADFNKGHIVDAKNMPYTTVDRRISELSAYKQKPIIIVCKMGQTATGIGKKLKEQGYEDVRRLSGGMAEWSAANLPLVKN